MMTIRKCVVLLIVSLLIPLAGCDLAGAAASQGLTGEDRLATPEEVDRLIDDLNRSREVNNRRIVDAMTQNR